MKSIINNIRPSVFDEYIGQEKIINNLKVYIDAAKIRNSKLDHMILHGNSGLGKTSLAYLIAKQLNKKIYILNGPTLQKASEIISPLTSLKEGDILFIDEIHAVSKDVYEILYPVLEDNQLNLIIGKEYNSKIVNIKLPNFTLIVATTELNRLSDPFINRFAINFDFQNYTKPEISQILTLNVIKMNLNLSVEVIEYLSGFCKLNPRICINLLKRINDYIISQKPKKITIKYITNVLNNLNIYQYGLNLQDINYLKLISKHKYIGLDTIRQILNISTATILNIIEPNLISNELITKTVRGRTITKKGVDLLKTCDV
ncbi:Holliday junction branch migration DNA helicase RuvB [Spiroplasma culicicola]|uniref:Holliday junction branch migration complex subunit RuvB n=1 Tax=Spiroplasma culicicola AES-1 TaxID=1276246 RepID=W6A7A0_9MOLU|nr:Holliday junction branch migration DNA helicase RuvB [Spiroplasma culicicola]AHI52872.1 Holliday junction DNA helicase RuvB [Spiroplasma culicicola AES-1]